MRLYFGPMYVRRLGSYPCGLCHECGLDPVMQERTCLVFSVLRNAPLVVAAVLSATTAVSAQPVVNIVSARGLGEAAALVDDTADTNKAR